MKKTITAVDRERGVFQVTAEDERFYGRPAVDATTGLPTMEFVPSVTWISSFYPKGIGFQKWLALHGWDEAEAIKQAAGDKGSKIHQAITDLVDGKTLAVEAEYVNPSSGQREPLTVEEYEALLSFADWWRASRPRTMLRDIVVWGEDYAGTLDWVGTLEDPPGLWLVDWKSSQSVWPEMEIQVSAYKHALLLDPPANLTGKFLPTGLPFLQLGILQVGYRANQRHWKLTAVADQYELFLAARAIWAKETAGTEIFRAEYPLELSLTHGPDSAPAPAIRRRRRKANAL